MQWTRRTVAAMVVALTLPVGIAPAASSADIGPMPYTFEQFSAAFLSHEDFRALQDWGSVMPDSVATPECSTNASGGYTCTRTYLNVKFTWSGPRTFSAATFPDPARALQAFSAGRAQALALGGKVLQDSPTEFGVNWTADGGRQVVTAGRLDRNHYLEVSCSGLRSPVPDINSCAQLLLNAQASRLAPFVSPVVVAPSSPTGVLATVKDGRAVVSWLAPERDGGAPITQYVAKVAGEALQCTSDATQQVVQSCVITGLKPGRLYSFTVTAMNSVGASADSAASKPGQFIKRPTAPRSVVATADGLTAMVRWQRPAESGGAPIQYYLVTASTGGARCRTLNRSCELTGLAYATTYRFFVVAVNGRGQSRAARSPLVRTPPAPAPSTTPAPEPSAPAPKSEQQVS